MKRFITSIIGLPFLILVVVLGGDILKAAMFLLIIIGMFEVYRAFSGAARPIHFAGYVFSAVYMFFIDYTTEYKVLAIILILMTMLTFCIVVLFFGSVNILDAMITLFGFYYVCLLLSTVYLVRNQQYGQFFVWLIFISAWGSDTGAYFVGRAFGKHKLIEKLSPKKTLEGAIGGVVLATILAMIYGIIVAGMLNIRGDFNVILYCAITGFLGSIFSQFGDLTASAIKRYRGIKDYGKIIPGHGGVMDRFDSVLFTAPAVYLTILVLFR